MAGETNNEIKTRQERREERLQKKKSKVKQHGRSFGQIYKDAVIKRLKKPPVP